MCTFHSTMNVDVLKFIKTSVCMHLYSLKIWLVVCAVSLQFQHNYTTFTACKPHITILVPTRVKIFEKKSKT